MKIAIVPTACGIETALIDAELDLNVVELQ